MGDSKGGLAGYVIEASRPGTMGRAERSVVSVLERIHELMAASVATHPDIEARAALRSGLVELEQLRERMIAEEVREAFGEMTAEDERGGRHCRNAGTGSGKDPGCLG
jgi:hypothetical protein